MNKEFIAKHIITKIDYSSEEAQIVKAIDETILELEHIRQFFDSVNDPKLVEMAIYSEEAIKAKYAYLLKEAKKLGIKLDFKYVFRGLQCS